ncbi:MAG: DDE-type integrase/transposase/recombinase [Phycisphaerae bacterium]|nr:DDE-type integrase/transposase/recombinase [Phycisphaerae bacterium]
MIGHLQQGGFPTAALCEVLRVHRARYYAWRRGSRTRRAEEDEHLKSLIHEIFWEHRRRYGARRIARELRGQMKESLVLAALHGAIALRQPGVGLIHHSDRGGQYAGNAYRRVLARAGMRQSMSRADNCYDNAFMESCFGTLKTELEMEWYETESIARSEIGGYIRYYNTRRRHSALDYQTPEAFETAGANRRPRWRNEKTS